MMAYIALVVAMGAFAVAVLVARTAAQVDTDLGNSIDKLLDRVKSLEALK